MFKLNGMHEKTIGLFLLRIEFNFTREHQYIYSWPVLIELQSVICMCSVANKIGTRKDLK